ncbi:DUF6126 family protein [Streptomyces rapamycinicus]|nr:DUF6126 family protein [Streptomyces rapamycinicus]MBB4781807.1 hypothetical protein [Streptomyces rapamycinicus]UTO62376.1 DUF6126 family protein [Streptomyces rapamycinicus]UTP30332.1 DUF6126 family protein [Streptomyces rapamycinicus NRRL 5491]
MSAAKPIDAAAATDAPMTPATPARSGPNEEDRAPMTFTVRVFIYLVGVHFIAAFLFFLFYVAGAK